MTSPTDPLEQFTSIIKEQGRRIADLERALRRSGGELRGLEAALPTSGAFDGQEHWATDTNRVRRWDGSGWIIMREEEQTYTPTLAGAGGNPNLGNTGTAVGAYRRRGGSCLWGAVFSFTGTGVTAGTGAWSVSLPKPCSAGGLGGFRIAGAGWLYNGAFHPITCDLNGSPALTPTVRMVYEGSAGVTSTAPGSIAAGAVLSLWGEFPLNTPYL